VGTIDGPSVGTIDGPSAATIDGAEVSVGLIGGVGGATVIDGIDVGSTVVAVGRLTGDVVGVQSSGLLPHQVPSHTLQLYFLA